MARLWYLEWGHYGKMAYSLARKIHRSGEKFDLVVGIARGGVPLAMVIADQLDLRVDFINVKSYTGLSKDKHTKPRILSTLVNGIRGNRILLVDDLIENGDTMKLVSSYLKKQRPKKLKTAVLFKRPWSKFEPDYSLKMVRRWVVFPWDKNETKRWKKQE